jgi:PPK2 family polyphosphate:nucleotide phosphotransferase
LFRAEDDPYLVPFDGTFDIAAAPTAPPEGAPSKKALDKDLAAAVRALQRAQRKLYADDRISILAVFQGMDTSGKDGTIRAVFTGVNPAGCHVVSFRAPSARDLDHDFLWRCVRELPGRGRIGVFNRSWYEEVLIVRVHPEILQTQRLPWGTDAGAVWDRRLASIRDIEAHLARNGTVVVKFFLHLSLEEQRRRLLARIDNPEKNWKMQSGDVRERRHWAAYQAAYEAALRATSREGAPWYAIPADDKRFMRLSVAQILVRTLQSLPIEYPTGPSAEALAEMRRALDGDG